jgi:hypothetical protein
LNAGLIPEVALVLVSGSEAIAKPGEHVVNLHGPEGDGVRKRNVEAATEHKVECIVDRPSDFWILYFRPRPADFSRSLTNLNGDPSWLN